MVQTDRSLVYLGIWSSHEYATISRLAALLEYIEQSALKYIIIPTGAPSSSAIIPTAEYFPSYTFPNRNFSHIDYSFLQRQPQDAATKQSQRL